MLVGPVFTREAITVPRRLRLYVSRTAYAAVLLLLMSTAWLVLTGTQVVSGVGDLARFGTILFQILAPLQLALAVLFSALLAASSVAQEKDRRTLTLLLLTRLTNSELVLGKLLSSLLTVMVMLAAALPVFMVSALLGGVSFRQVAAAFAVTLAGALAAGSLGSTIALWREKTFQALALTALVLVFWLALWEIVALGLVFERFAGLQAADWAIMLSPWQAILEACRPPIRSISLAAWSTSPLGGFLLFSTAAAVAINGVAIVRIRKWNPIEQDRLARRPAGRPVPASEPLAGSRPAAAPRWVPQGNGSARPAKVRPVWDNPVLWRELRTWAYGRKVLVVRGIYLLLFGVAGLLLASAATSWQAAGTRPGARRVLPPEARPLLPLLVVSLVLVNAQAVTSLTAERDGRALDLLLATDLTPSEIIFGKLGGALYNAKEMILLPMLACVYLWSVGRLSGENLLYVLGGLLVMDLFVAVLGVHVGMIYESSRTAIGVSLGTLLFLFLGVATCMRIMIAFSGSFQVQLQPFLAFMLGGGVGLYLALGHRNPSPAIGLASFLAPFATFYVITSFILGYPLAVFLVTVITYGFATAAMLIPALYEFDVATGRTTADHF